MSCCCSMNRREFLEVTAIGAAGATLGLAASGLFSQEVEDWDPNKPLLIPGKPLTVQPVLMYRVPERKPETSWKSWGGVQSDQSADEEANRITQELAALAARCDFALQVLPIIKVKTPEEAAQVHTTAHDVVLVYPATGGGKTLQACFSPTKHTMVFVRHQSGPVYYWYEAMSVAYLQTEKSELTPVTPTEKKIHVEDVVVDDYDEMQWRLRALYGVKNFLGTRIVALGGSWGKYAAEAPQVAQEKFRIQIVDVPYEAIEKRLAATLADKKLARKAKKWTSDYLNLFGTTLKTEEHFVVNAFLLYTLFKDLMRENDATAFTIKSCMGTIMPMSKTTACLTLGLLNDEGYLAFCESDFVVIPPGVLLRHISGRPVFLHNSTFPHKGMVTCAHCTGPRRMDGARYESAEIVTHYESVYGAAPKVFMPIDQEVTFFDPEYSTLRWLGFKGIVKANPFYDICRSQQDVEICGDWKKLKSEARDSHWVMAYGDYLKEGEYAARKIGVKWEGI